jgi:hypothetical protein
MAWFGNPTPERRPDDCGVVECQDPTNAGTALNPSQKFRGHSQLDIPENADFS